MKKITLTWLCLTLTTAFALAADYHLIQTQMADGEYTERSGLAGKFPPTVWVLIQPDGKQPWVFQKLDSPMMEAHLRMLPHASVVHIHFSPVLVDSVSQTQREPFKAFCQKYGLKYVDDSLSD